MANLNPKSPALEITPKDSLWQRFFSICTAISLMTGSIFFLAYGEKSVEGFLFCVLVAASYTFPIAFANGWINDYLDKKYSWVEDTQRRLVWGIFATVLINAAVIFGRNYIDFIWYQKQNPDEFFSGEMGRYNIIVLTAALFISVILHARGFILDWKNTSKQQVTEQKIIAKSANAQFESLKNQLDPHFLFNSLNVLDALIEENPQQAQKFTNSMSKIYRYVLDQKDKELVTVQEELDFAKTYAELLKTRFEDSVNFTIEVNDEVKQQFVVPLSLQLLLENAIKHNYATTQKPLNIKIYSESGQLVVENNIQLREMVREREGIGLSNIGQRYSLLAADNVKIENSNELFKVKIPMLNEKISAMNPQPSINFTYERALERVQDLKKFYSSLIVYAAVISLLAFLNWKSSSEHLWFLWVAGFWGFSLSLKAMKLFALNEKWEQKQITKILKNQ